MSANSNIEAVRSTSPLSLAEAVALSLASFRGLYVPAEYLDRANATVSAFAQQTMDRLDGKFPR